MFVFRISLYEDYPVHELGLMRSSGRGHVAVLALKQSHGSNVCTLTTSYCAHCDASLVRDLFNYLSIDLTSSISIMSTFGLYIGTILLRERARRARGPRINIQLDSSVQNWRRLCRRQHYGCECAACRLFIWWVSITTCSSIVLTRHLIILITIIIIINNSK